MGLRADKKDRLRRKILDNAIQLFKARGFDDVTIGDIIGELEISQATFFNYFPSKDAILHQAAEDIVLRYQEMLEREAQNDAPTREKIHHLLETMGKALQADRRFYRTLFTRSVLNFGNVRAERLLSEFSAAILRQGQQRGEIRTDCDPHELADSFIGTYYTIIMRWLSDDGASNPLTERLHRGAEIFFSGVARAPARPAAQPPRRTASRS